jgi:beta-lactamase class A
MSSLIASIKKPWFKKTVIALAVILLLGWIISNKTIANSPLNDASISIRENSPEFKYINPILFSTDPGDPSPELNSLKNSLINITNKDISNNDAKRISVYFRDLDGATWTGVNEKDTFNPSSMLKVLTLMAYVKIAEDNPDILNEAIYSNYKDDPGQYYKPIPLSPGQYSVTKLLQQMITQSDNSAMDVLNARHAPALISAYSALRMPNPLTTPDYKLSPQQYSYIFRALYNAAYISNDYAEQALKLMTFTTFNNGLVAGIDKNIEISHKFGEHTVLVNGQVSTRELHDCGIMYFPNKPIFLCVMTEGQDFSKLEGVIQGVSSLVNQYVKRDLLSS